MKTFRLRFINILGIMAAPFLWFPSATAQEDVATIIRRSSEVNNRDWAAVLFPHKREEDDLYFHYHKAENTDVGHSPNK